VYSDLGGQFGNAQFDQSNPNSKSCIKVDIDRCYSSDPLWVVVAAVVIPLIAALVPVAVAITTVSRR
jgi:hypothetical protein